MKTLNWTSLLFLATLFCCTDGVQASPLPQDTTQQDGAYRLYPLGIACRDGDMAAIRCLLAGSNEPMAMENDCYEFDILYTAIHFGKEEVLRYALTRCKDINGRLYSDEYGLTLLTYACKQSDAKSARILLEHGIDVNGHQSPCDTYTVYPIMEAIANRNIGLVRLLLEYHADLDVRDSNGNTPLSLAKETGAEEIETLLLQYMEQPDTLYIETEETEFEILYRLCCNQQGKKNVVFELEAADDSSIDFMESHTVNGARKFDCFAVYDGVADGNRFLFFDYESRTAYMTPACFSGFRPVCSSVDFSKGEVLLQNGHSPSKHPSDTLSIDSKTTYVPFDRNHRMVKAPLVPYPQAGKGHKRPAAAGDGGGAPPGGSRNPSQ